jgi:protoporphyrinogen oxidase
MKIAIIGAGICGLTTAWNLRKAGHEITVFEKDTTAGGLAGGFKEPQWQDSVEKFYHHCFTTDKALLDLIRELGLSDQIEFRTPKSVMYHNGKFYPFDSIPAAILYPGLGFGLNKIRFGLVGLYLRLFNRWQILEKTTAKAWMSKFAGQKVYRSMWEPMVIGKFGEKYADQINMAWLWARIYSRTTSLGTFRGGFQCFFDRFTEILKSEGVDFKFGTTVQSVTKNQNADLVVTTDGSSSRFDRVLITTSPKTLLKIVPEISGMYKEKLEGLKNLGAVVLTISLKKPLSPQGYYWYNLPKNEGFPFLALVEHTNFVASSHFNGETILYAGDYLEQNHEYFSLSKEDLLQKIIPGLKKINPEFREDWVINCWKFSTEYAQPIPFINHSKNIPDITTSIPGLYFASMSQVYPWDRGINYSVDLANRVSSVIRS